jgi:hypothetical protein
MKSDRCYDIIEEDVLLLESVAIHASYTISGTRLSRVTVGGGDWTARWQEAEGPCSALSLVFLFLFLPVFLLY